MAVVGKEFPAIEAVDPAETLDVARIMARALAEAKSDTDRLPLARAFCYRLVAAWWSAITGNDQNFPLRPLLEQHHGLDHLPEPAAASADSIGSSAAAFDPETAAYAIGRVAVTSHT